MSMLTSGTFFLGARYKWTGSYAPPDWLEDLRQYSAILFGAVGDPDVPDHISLWELILPMRQKFQQFVNVRPCTIYDGMQAPTLRAQSGEDLDWVILRENTEGEYAGQGGRTHVGTPMEVATEVAIFTRMGIERFMRFAFATAASRPKKLLTVVTKSNAQVREHGHHPVWARIEIEARASIYDPPKYSDMDSPFGTRSRRSSPPTILT